MKKLYTVIFLLSFIYFSITSFGQIPAISSFSPVKGFAGGTVTITGTNFDASPGNNIVYFGGAKATVVNASSTLLTVTIPYGATYDQIKILNTTSQLWGYSGKYFLPISRHTSTINTSTFSQTSASGSNVDSYGGMKVGDMDLDGKTDVITAGRNSNGSVIFWKNNSSTSTMSISNAQTLSVTSAYRLNGFAIGDLNGDGYLDIVAIQWNTSTSGNYISYWLNNATGSSPYFGSEVGPTLLTSTTYGDEVEIADVDNDGKNDIIVGANYRMVLLRNTSSVISSPVFTEQAEFNTRNSFRSILTADVDNNNITDIIGIGLPSTTNASDVILNQSSPGALSYYTTGGGLNSIIASSGCLADINNDGKLDIIVNGTSSGLNIHENTNTVPGTISFNSASVAFSRSSGTGYEADAGDLNGDGKPDIVISTYDNTNGLSIFPNAGSTGSINSASLLSEVRYFPSGTPRFSAARIADLNNDGNNDIIGISDVSFNNALYIYKNNSAGAVLPVKFSEFTCKLVNDKSDLAWSTESEINNNRFEIEHSVNGSNYEKIGTVYPLNLERNYRFTHSNPVSGVNYYRIKQIDNDSKFSYSEIRKVIIKESFKITAFPNPFINELTIYTGQNSIKNCVLQVSDMSGKKVLSNTFNNINNNLTIRTDSWTSGVYVIRLLKNNGEIIFESLNTK